MTLINNFWKGKRVLITGHTGFKGSWLSLYLHNLGASIVGCSLPPTSKQLLFEQLNLKDRINHNIVDICNIKSINGLVNDCNPDIVFHLAAQSLVRDSYVNPLTTWKTNVLGSLNLLESIKTFQHSCVVIVITTDKVYENKNWAYGYRENDSLGGDDPYSASKAALEIAVASWRKSFCGSKPYQNPNLFIATCRAGNVIGGGDWGENRIIPDIISCLKLNKNIKIRNKSAIRPWQHVLEPLSGYIKLARKIYESKDLNRKLKLCSSFNFGPNLESNKTVLDLVNEVLKHWEGNWEDISNENDFYESKILKLNVEKSYDQLEWEPSWSFSEAVSKTTLWYRDEFQGILSPYELCMKDIKSFKKNSRKID